MSVTEDKAFELWTLRQELSEEVVLGGQLVGNNRFLDLERKLAYTHRDPWRQKVAAALVEYADAGGNFEDEYKMVLYLDSKGLTIPESNLDALTESLAHYKEWLEGHYRGMIP